MTLVSEAANGAERSSHRRGPVIGLLAPKRGPLAVLANTNSVVSVEMRGVVDDEVAPAARENWTITLRAGSRDFELRADGALAPGAASMWAVRRQWELAPSSVYAWYGSGGSVVQMRNATAAASHFASREPLLRFYALGSPQGDHTAGNMSFDWSAARGERRAVVLRSGRGRHRRVASGLHEVLCGGPGAGRHDQWGRGGRAAREPRAAKDCTSGSWSHTARIAPNRLDFPAGSLATGVRLASEDGANLAAMLVGIYATAAGCLSTHRNGVVAGQTIPQIATSIAQPERGYSNEYNFFDPDSYLSINALLMSNEPHLLEEVRRVLERTAAFVKPTGQVPHHFRATSPVYAAISGATMPGPNIFWILSCLSYAKAAQNTGWLRQRAPVLRRAFGYIHSMVDRQLMLARAPGALMIDVFRRWGYTSDTNGAIVGLAEQFADAEEALGNRTGAAQLRRLAAAVGEAMRRHLWASAGGDDHFVTQWGGPASNATRDLVDYDSNLIAAAHGVVVDRRRAERLLARVDRGRCRAAATYVSEKAYGVAEVTACQRFPGATWCTASCSTCGSGGNTGDSYTGMGRIAWFDALARQRFGDAAGFDRLLLAPLRSRLLSSTWMHERVLCDGSPSLNRTAGYFEYPSVVAMMVRAVRYGIDVGFGAVAVVPLGVERFSYRLNGISVDFAPDAVAIEIGILGARGSRAFRLAPLRALARYRARASGDGCGGAAAVPSTPSTDARGELRLDAPVGVGCRLEVELMAVAPQARSSPQTQAQVPRPAAGRRQGRGGGRGKARLVEALEL